MSGCILAGVEFSFVVTRRMEVVIQVALLLVQLPVGLVQAGTVALECVLVPL